MLAHPSCINVIAQSMSTDNVKTKIQGQSYKSMRFSVITDGSYYSEYNVTRDHKDS